MKPFNKVAIIGVGLIGGSLALDIKRLGLCKEVVGVSRHKESLLLARRKKAIDQGSQELDIIKGADLLILAMPVNAILSLAPRIAKLIPKDCIVTDVGSTKQEIIRKLQEIFPNFIGAHPMAGSERRGIANARAGIFKGSLCILTPTCKTNRRALARVNRFWRALGAKTISLEPAIHDKALSFVSHLPHILAFSLIDIVPRAYLKFASSGLKDTTRIAASESELWSDIFLSNRHNLLNAIGRWEKSLSGIKKALKLKDKKSLNKILAKSKLKRDALR